MKSLVKAALIMLASLTASLSLTVLPARGALRILPKGRSAGNPLEAGQVETELYLNDLAGTYRAHLLARQAIRERVITIEELKRSDRIYLINSVRKWIEAELVA